MRLVSLLAPLAVLGAACVASPEPSSDVVAESSSLPETPPAQAGFDPWLREQCPSGAVVHVTNTDSGEPLGTVACDDFLSQALADPVVRARLIDEYTATQQPPLDDEVGEARQRWSPAGFICGLIAAAVVGYGCQRSHLSWGQCFAIRLAPAVGCMVAF